MTKVLANSFKPSTFTSALLGIVPDMGNLFGRFSVAQRESQELPERLRFDIGQTDIDPGRASLRSSAGTDLDMMWLRAI